MRDAEKKRKEKKTKASQSLLMVHSKHLVEFVCTGAVYKKLFSTKDRKRFMLLGLSFTQLCFGGFKTKAFKRVS